MAEKTCKKVWKSLKKVFGKVFGEVFGEVAALRRAAKDGLGSRSWRSDPRPAGTGLGSGKRGSGLQYQIVYETSKTIWEECTTLGRLVSF